MSNEDDEAIIVSMRCSAGPAVTESVKRNCFSCSQECWLSVGMLADRAGSLFKVCCVECLMKAKGDLKLEDTTVGQMGINQITDIADTCGLSQEEVVARTKDMDDCFQAFLSNKPLTEEEKQKADRILKSFHKLM